MAAILQDWISNRLHKKIRWTPDEFGEIMKDGSIIAQLLHSYAVINDDQLFITRKTTDREHVKKNWTYIHLWLKDIDIDINELIPQILEGDRSVLLKLFYQIFLNLEKKDRLVFLKKERERKSAVIEKKDDRFKIISLEEPVVKETEELARPLVSQQSLKEWYKKKVNERDHTLGYLRSRLSRFNEKRIPPKYHRLPKMTKNVINKNTDEMNKFENLHEKSKNTFEQLEEMQKQCHYETNDADSQIWAQNYLSSLNDKVKRRRDEDRFHRFSCDAIRTLVWNNLLDESEAKASYELAKCVMKLSQYEKQMCTQLMEIKQQTRNLILNRMTAEREYNSERDLQFLNFMAQFKRQAMMREDEYMFELQRQEELKQRLKEKKQQGNHEANYIFCYQTLEALVDIAIKYSYTMILFEEVPDHCIRDWKNLFFKEQSIFEMVADVETIFDSEMEPEQKQSIIIEIARQNCLNNADFQDYHKRIGEWCFEFWEPNFNTEEEINRIHTGSVITAHVIYSLLNEKYPLPAPSPPLELLHLKSKAILYGLLDLSLSGPLQLTLRNRRISVIRIEQAVNFCIMQFKKETDNADQNFSYDISKENVSSKDIPLDSGLFDVPPNISQESILPENDQKTQTPLIFPGDMTYSLAANIGLSVHEALSIGSPISDTLMSKVVAEYIKSLTDMEGFVLVNYPNTFKQAQELEELFTGCRPLCEIEKYESKEVINELDTDPNKKKRISRLYDDPHTPECHECNTFFTSFITMKECENIYDEHFVWQLNELNSNLIERFYADKGINHRIYYSEISKDLVAAIGRYIIGDLTIPHDEYETLFGCSYSSIDVPTIAGRHNVPKAFKCIAKRTSQQNNVTSSHGINIRESDRLLKENSLKIVRSDIDVISGEHSDIETVRVNPGEKGWIYATVSAPNEFLSCLGYIWEEAEKSYIEQMNQLFFNRRLILYNLIPYVRFTKDKIAEVISRPDEKQNLINDFIKEFNEFNNDWRVHVQSKLEWHCRINELQKQLLHICDVRRKAAEDERYSLIGDVWSLNASNILANSYVSSMQAELNRSVTTYQILQDFYLTILKPNPNLETLVSKELHLITSELESFIGDLPTTSKKSVTEKDKSGTKLKQHVIDMHFKNIQFDEINNNYYTTLENNVKIAIKHGQDICDSFSILIHKEATELTKASLSMLKRKTSSAFIDSVDSENFRENCAKCLDEWSIAIEGELSRLCMRLQMLLQKSLEDIKVLTDYLTKAFVAEHDLINLTYQRECKAVESFCKYLQHKVEEEKQIPEPVVFNETYFEITEIPSREIIVPKLKATGTALYFKVGQLKYLLEQLKLVAPNGFLLAAALYHVCQDFLLYGKEKGILPRAWYYVEPENMLKIIHEIYGGSDFLDWRGFLLFMLHLECPDVYKLIDAKHSFVEVDVDRRRTVTIEEFTRVRLWDQLNPCPDDDNRSRLKKYMIRAFLFEAIKNEQDELDYNQFLYFFCKDACSVLGFGKAISVKLGKKVCYEPEWIPYVRELMKRRKQKDLEHMEAINWSFRYIDDIIDIVMKRCNIVEPQGKKKSGVQINLMPQRDVSTIEEKELSNPEFLENFDEMVKDKIFTVPPDVIISVLLLSCPWFESFRNAESNIENPVHVLQKICNSMTYDTDNQELYICLFLDDPFVRNFCCEIVNKFTYKPVYHWIEKLLQFKNVYV